MSEHYMLMTCASVANLFYGLSLYSGAEVYDELEYLAYHDALLNSSTVGKQSYKKN